MMIDETINSERTVCEGGAPKAVRLRAGDEILGRYVVEDELGQGGMGVVYKCLDKVGGVEVAVKDLPPEVSHSVDEMEEIRDNYRLVSDLRHPNICGVRTLERDATGDYHLVMDLGWGENLNRWMRRHPEASLAAKFAILRQIAAALDYAHARKLIHRDVKPENVLVDADGHVSVLDFGLAAQIRSGLSRTSQVITSKSGTPAYKSPEQWAGRPQMAAADQYALGVIAFRLISGGLPFEGDDLRVLGQAVLQNPVPSIPGVPRSVNLALARALAKNPESRFPTCSAFISALMCTPPSPLRRRLVAVGLLAFLLVVVGVGVWHVLQAARGGAGKRDVETSVAIAESDRQKTSCQEEDWKSGGEETVKSQNRNTRETGTDAAQKASGHVEKSTVDDVAKRTVERGKTRSDMRPSPQVRPGAPGEGTRRGRSFDF